MVSIRLFGTAAAAAVGLVALIGCGSPNPAPAGPAPSASADAPAAADTSVACAAVPRFDAAVISYPGVDSDTPPPADALRQWGTTAAAALGALAAAAPAELESALGVLRTAIDGTVQGTPIDVGDPALTAAAATVEKWGYDNCGFPRLDVTGTGTDLPGVPPTQNAGPLAVKFDNGGTPEKGLVLLVARVRDGAQYTLDGIRNGSVDFNTIADVVGAAQPPEGDTAGYSIATLTPGKYLVLSPIGVPPQFSGTVAAEFEVA